MKNGIKESEIELLAPAGSLKKGIAAIDAGADAVYIGGPAFGARERAGNSMEEIGELARYAHQFGAKVYQTINTIIYDHELADVEKIVWQAWEAGVDAIIVQDMALLEMKLPPIPLHASTQAFNLTADRVQFLEAAGFDRVILERSLSLDEIRKISESTNLELETFIHGALCVGYSGQCYLSEAIISGRSGNRGSCAQPCRSQWNLENSKGDWIRRDETLLSVTDLNLSDNLAELIEAGASSFKIEGRLKDEAYVTNNVAYYNHRLMELGIRRSSVGRSSARFNPNPEKSFSRSFSTFFLEKRLPTYSLLNRSQGEYIGQVVRVGRDFFELDRDIVINNGDGLSFNGMGTNVNTASDRRIFPNRMDGIAVGLEIYRNLDRAFQPESERKIDATIEFGNGIIKAKDESGVEVEIAYQFGEEATNTARAEETIKNAFAKSGDTIFAVQRVDVRATPFMPMSSLNELRRSLLERLLDARVSAYQRPSRKNRTTRPSLDGMVIDYRGNVANHMAREFYEKYGAKEVLDAYEVSAPLSDNTVVMRTRHCIRRELGLCLKEGTPPEQLFLENNGRKFALEFDCAACEMMVVDQTKTSL